jgi:hypothetical protein
VRRAAATADEFTPEELAEMNTYPNPQRVVEIRAALVDVCREHAPGALPEAERLLTEAKENAQ